MPYYNPQLGRYEVTPSNLIPDTGAPFSLIQYDWYKVMVKCGAASPLYACTTIKTFGGINPSGMLTCWSYAYFTFWIKPIDLQRKRDTNIMFADVSRVGAAFSEVAEDNGGSPFPIDVACFLFYEETDGSSPGKGGGLSVYMGRHDNSATVSILNNRLEGGEKCSSRAAAT